MLMKDILIPSKDENGYKVDVQKGWLKFIY